MRNDAELLRRYAEKGSEDAFTEFVRRNIGLVYASAARRLGGDEHRAGEVAQQVFIAAARNARVLARHCNTTGWLFTATRNAALNLMRDEQRRAHRELEVALATVNVESDEPSRNWADLRPVLDAAMDGLNERDREAVLLRYFSGLPLDEIGRRFGASENTTRMRVQRALEKLQARLKRQGISSTAAALGVALTQRAAADVPTALTAQIASNALASGLATMGSAAMAGGFFLMSTSKWIAVAAGVCALAGLVGVSHHTARTRKDSEEALALARREHARRLEQLDAERGRALAAERGADALAAQLEAARAAERTAAASAARAAEPEPPWDPTAEGAKFMARHPAVKRALTDYFAASVRFKYGALFRDLGWSEEQIAEFVRLNNFGGSMGASAESGNSISLRHGDATPPPDWNERFNRLLGPDGVRRFAELREQQAGRYLAADVASALYFTGTPLRPEQARELIDIVTATRPPQNRSGFSAPAWQNIIAKAGDLLTPAQLDVLSAQRAKSEFNRMLNQPRLQPEPPATGGK